MALKKITDSISAPLSQYSESHKRIDKSHPAYILCKTGNRAKQYSEKLILDGFKDLIIVEGGLTAWLSEGFLVEKNEENKIWSLERQVRVAAGSLVVLGAMLARTIFHFW